MANTYLTRTQSSGTSDKIGTFSSWIKLSSFSEAVFSGHTDSNNRIALYFSDTLRIYGAIGGSQSVYLITNQVFRDPSAWYHIVIAWDTTQGTDSNRFKVYVNGSQVTSFSTASYPTQNADVYWNKGTTSIVGARFVTSITNYFNGSMSHVHFIDGTAYDASAFGETDATTGEWVGKTSPSVTYGTNGFFILKDGNGITDQSGEGNDFTLGGGTLTDLKDNPDNVFATISPLYYSAEKIILEFGNLRTNGLASGESAAWRSLFATLGNSSGKYYFETKIETSTAGNNFWIGIVDDEQIVATGDNGEFYNTSRGYAYGGQSGTKGNNGADASYGDTYTTNDIIGCAFDLDNHKIYWSKNGVWQNSGDPTSGATGTGSAFNLATGYTYIPSFATFNNDERYAINFGNGYFGTTPVSSAGTNASDNGIFEYDVPTGYTALSTKGLNL